MLSAVLALKKLEAHKRLKNHSAKQKKVTKKMKRKII